MSDHEHGAGLHKILQSALDFFFALGIQMRSRFIEDQDRGVFEKRAGDRDPLALPARKLESPFAQRRVITLRKRVDEMIRIRDLRGLSYIVQARLRPAVSDILADRGVEKHGFLGNDPDQSAQGVKRETADILAVDRDGAPNGIIEAQQQIDERRFPRTARSHERDDLIVLGPDLNIPEDP